MMLKCPEPECDYTYLSDKPGLYRNHRAGVHVLTAKVHYSGPNEEVTLVREGLAFQCIRCPHTSAHPNTIQVGKFYFDRYRLFTDYFFH